MVESVTTTNNAPRQYIHILEHFFDSIDSNTLFDATDPIYFRRLRDDLYDALYQLLFWLRPVLEVEKGLHWPYEGLTRRVSFFENAVAESPDHFIQRQACLFLARLPFPRQWQWLARAQDNFGSDPEIETFLRLEQRRIEKKLKKKRQNTFLLRHFCQILKKPRLPEEKGVLRIFSLPYLFVNPELLKALNRLYFLYVEPPWGIVFRQAWLRPFATLDDPTLFGLNGEEDAAFMRSQPGIRTTVLAHGDFLEDDESLKFDQEKRFDIVFNGTFDEMPRKRHAHMLELLRHPLLHRRKALFMGRGDPRNVEAFEQLIQSSGLSPRVTVRADLPCVIATSMAGVNSAIINAQTGIAAPDRDLPRAISQALENRDKFRPRDWFLSHSGSTHSSRKLNDQLKAFFRDLGYSWQEDIVPLTSGGASRYVDRSHYVRLRPQFEELLKIFQNHARLPILPRFD
jgi:glycosyltransferase involved in cell wall biosynthesis